jgi:hypothetical protein
MNTNRTIYDIVFACSSPGTLARFSRTCRGSYDAVNSFNRCAFNINQHLSRFIDDPIGFRSMQAQTGTLISGSNALQFLDRTLYENSDLDLYVHDLYRYEVGAFLQEHGYVFMPNERQDARFGGPEYLRYGTTNLYKRNTEANDYNMQGVAAVFNFWKEGSSTHKIQLITATHSPLEIILNFHSCA